MAPDVTIPLSLKPMEAEPVDDLPQGKGWLYEPKYDGFRCLAFRDGDKIDLQSKKQKSLNRFFPEVAAGLGRLMLIAFRRSGIQWRSCVVVSVCWWLARRYTHKKTDPDKLSGRSFI
jgi:hypothetical protein